MRTSSLITPAEALLIDSLYALGDTSSTQALKKSGNSVVNASITGSLIYGGTWNASTNTPTLASGTGTLGVYYYVSVAGATNLDGITSWAVGDMLIFNGTVWQKIDNTDAVTSVAGMTGAVTLSLDNLTDVAITAVGTGDFLRYNGTNFVNTTIGASDIPSGIDAAKIADGSVSNTEFQYVNGVTSAIQTQIDGKANTALSNLASVAINAALELGTSDAFALGSATKMWSDLFLASGGVINWNAGDVTITHSANTLAFAGASSGYTFDNSVQVNGNTSFPGTASANGYMYHGNVTGLVLYGEGTTSDVLIANKTGNTVMSIPTGTTTAAFINTMTIGSTGLAGAASLTMTSQGSAFISLVADTDNVTETDTAYVKYSQDGAQVIGWSGFTGNADTLPDGSAYTGILQNSFVLGGSLGTSQGFAILSRNSSPANVISIQCTGATSALAFNHGTGGTTFTGTCTTVTAVGITANSLTTGGALSVSSSSADTGTRTIESVSNSNAASTGVTLVTWSNSSTGGLLSATASATTANVISVTASSLTTGSVAYFYSNSADTTGRNLVQIINDNAASTGTTPLYIQQDSTAGALAITAASTTSNAFDVVASSLTTGGGARIYSDSADTGTRNLVNIVNDNAASSGTTALNIQQDAVQVSLNITTLSTTAHALVVTGSSLTTGSLARLYSNSSDGTSGRALLHVINDNTAAVFTIPIQIQQDAAWHGFYMDQNANYYAHTVVSASTTFNVMRVVASSLTSGSIMELYSNSSDSTARQGISIHNDHTGATGFVPLTVIQDAVTNTNFKKIATFAGKNVWVSDGTTPVANLTTGIATGDICMNGPAGQPFYYSGVIWIAM